jgi:hypothetical protein
MKRVVGVSLSVVVGIVIAACSGSTGPAGAAGAKGATGATGPAGTSDAGPASVSAITPPYAFLGRTVDLTIAGSGTSWDSKTTVAFSDPKITVNKVTVASASGLLVNITVAAGATIAAGDVTVTDGTATAVYKGAFEVRGPIVVSATPTAGVPQGGIANIHVALADLTTPFDPNTATVTVGSADLTPGTPTITDFAVDIAVEADVLATAGSFDVTTTSGPTGSTVSSVAAKSFAIVARTPVKLVAGTAATGSIATPLDTGLYEFTPAAATQEFVQFHASTSTSGGALSTIVLPKSGKFADAINPGFGLIYGAGTTSVDPLYLVVGDSNSPLTGPGPTPAASSLVVFESACTASSEETETTAANNDVYTSAEAITTLPALVSGTLGYGTVTPDVDVDVYKITVTGTGKTIHAATGGDPADDSVITILDSTGATLATSSDLDFQEDISTAAATAGTYYVSVTSSTSGAFNTANNTYQLFVSVQ